MNNDHAKTCREVFEVLRLTPKTQLELIPIEVLNKLKNDSKSYTEKYKLEFDKMGEPKISHEAQVMILAIYRKYFLQDDERKCLNNALHKNENKIEIKKANNYNNSSDIFYKSNNSENTKITIENDIKNELNDSKNHEINQEKNDLIVSENDEINQEKNSLIISENKVIIFIKSIINKIKNIFK